MVAKLLFVVGLATSVLAHPNHKRHNRFHLGTGTGNGLAMPTGATYPITNGTAPNNGTDFGGSPIESPSSVEATSVLPTATAAMTVTVVPVPIDSSSPDTGKDVSSVPTAIAIPSNTEVAPAGDSPAGSPAPAPAPVPGSGDNSCSVLTSTITSTSIQYVTVTAGLGDSALDVAPTGGPGASSGPSSLAPSGGAGEFFQAPGSMTSASSSTTSGPTSLASASDSISAGAPAAGEFFPHPGKQSSVPASGGSASAAVPSYGGGASSVIPTTFATIPSSAPSSSAALSASSGSPSSTPSSSPSTGGSTGGKKGLSYNTASLTNAFAGKGISWAYNWGASPDGSIVSGAEYVPMFWGPSSVSGWANAAAAAISSGSKHALSLNEPDLASQANVDPATAAKLHIENMNPLAGQVQIGSPAVTNGAGSSPLMGIDWLNQWFSECKGNCKVDFVAFHWYDSANNLDYFKSHVQDVIDTAAKNGVGKVWLTEFGATGSDSDVANFLQEAVSWLDSQPAVERYAYFMCADGILVKGNSISSPVGAAYS
ncbi:hypothetical protein A1O7_09154 [Cladophialophora yegresii CBS 114405]|uniref:Asl1-like glycosyl hydrolase catalytic domain-containing protein n=1 Tax=Cladophialophora yegresii CBS 114405 TaxID=1182544 RepID=W9VE98_9EURO|nr:uncharacterized protein A1O7_09154 [Cladophialophora yegresii CBS 114405]EXJ53818.1 hypothetical protein A1O7_09154 [Cladophialophora yegresii CBS 114405]